MDIKRLNNALTFITIGVCVRNCASTIREAIESIMAQDYPHELMEVIFVDDGSEDDTLSIIKEYEPKMDIKVKIFHHEWKGLGFSRNIVVKNASGKYIIWVDGDMTIPKNFVRKQFEFMRMNPKVGIAKARYGLPHKDNIVAILENIPYVVSDLKNVPLDSKLPGTGGSIYRTKAIRQVGGFDEGLTGVGEDQDAASRIKDAGWLIERTDVFFFEKREQSWRELLHKYFWYGYGNYKLYRKNKKIFKLIKMNPIAGFLAGALLSVCAYRLVRKKIVFLLLPFHFALKMTAWCLGFIKHYITASVGS
ncbi:MAG: glycosyltransferase [Candidatus Bathyarchaeia archaeon]